MPKTSWIALGAALAVIVIGLSVASFINQQQSASQKPASSGFAVKTLDQKDTLERDIKTTFTSSKHQDIITYVNLAASEKDKAIQYSYYVKAYAKMLPFYNETKDTTMKRVIEELSEYVKTFPQYKAIDFPPIT